jgi:hypothetical protein
MFQPQVILFTLTGVFVLPAPFPLFMMILNFTSTSFLALSRRKLAFFVATLSFELHICQANLLYSSQKNILTETLMEKYKKYRSVMRQYMYEI